MKLQTMLLPTGEFVLVLSEVTPNSPTGEFLNNLQKFKESTGAAALFVTNESAEVEDALYDDDARRVDDVGEWKDLGYTNEGASLGGSMFMAPLDETHTFRADDFGRAYLEPRTTTIKFDSQDSKLLDLLRGGAEFSPAGLVKSPGSAQEKLELGHYELTGCGRPHHVEVDSDGVAEVVSRDPENPATSAKLDSPRAVGRFPDTGPQHHDIDLDEVTVGETWEDDEPPTFVPGTPVEIIGGSYFGFLDDEVLGQKGTVIENEHLNTPEGCVLVGGLSTKEYDGAKLFFHPSSLQPIPVDLCAQAPYEDDQLVLTGWMD